MAEPIGWKWRTAKDVGPPRLGPAGSWTPPTDPSSLTADPATVCDRIAATQDVDRPDREVEGPWGPQVRAKREALAALWAHADYGQYLVGGSHTETTAVWPGPVGPAWELADGRALVPCQIVQTRHVRPAPGKTVPLLDSGFEQTVGDGGTATRWSRWEATHLNRVLVVIPRKGTGPVDYLIDETWPLWADGDRTG
ncbi:hypothetical protein [Embleya sp. NBC_00896]|uniref:hypothetical protein n=1 Tax=Embleya sp. NBC_00896 TaxID=2975961 RepID=UPI002F916DCE|nr:hypothetical protein OG928_47655 [Embleya sp. NBC_00896]